MEISTLFKRALTSSLFGLSLAPGWAQSVKEGQTLYQQKCAACHQAKGQGIPGAFPALANSKFVQGDATTLALTVLKGRGGMPTFKDALNDSQLASVLTYIRSSLSNEAEPIEMPLVATARQSVSNKINMDNDQSASQSTTQ